MKKIFLDAGAHEGCSVRQFRSEHDPKEEYFIYSFEPNPDFKSSFNNFSNHKFISKAVWIKDGKTSFYIGRNWLNASSTLLKRKRSGNIDKENPITVKTIDFSKWVLDNFKKEDYIILKMDIEGAEYQVLEKMIKDGSINYINELWIEWHMRKINKPVEEHDKLVSLINIPIKKWDALKKCTLRGKRRGKQKI